MTIDNYFPKLNQLCLGYIFRKAGTISNFPKVCKFFNETLKTEAEWLYNGLKAEFGDTSLCYVLKTIGLKDKSYAAKIDGLFHVACKNHNMEIDDDQEMGGELSVKYDLNALRLHMRPLMQAEGLGALWIALHKIAHPQLKALMSHVHFSDQPLNNAQLIRQFFCDHPKELRQIHVLDLSEKHLKLLPEEIKYFIGMKKLDLSKNSLTELPKEIGCLTELHEFRLNHNLLHSLPGEIGHLSCLQNFQCSFNRLKTLPDEICQLKKLRTLNLARNQLAQLPEQIGALQSLNYLALDSNQLMALPVSLMTLPFLVGLYLFHNQLSALPDSLCKMQHLKFLSVQNNVLQALPENIGEMPSLQSLFVDGNELKELPASLCSLKNLNRLSISRNQLSKMPSGMENLENLDFFHYAGNPLQNFPEGIQGLPFWSIHPELFPRLNHGVEQTFLNASLTDAQFTSRYWRLGPNKWKECIDGIHHVHGSDVYDTGSHGKHAEPGFLASMMRGFQFLSDHPNRKVDAEFYLTLHKAVCGHFKGEETNTLMGQEKVGVFRGLDDAITASFKAPDYLMTQDAINEFNNLNGKLTLALGSSFRIGDLVLKSNTPRTIGIYYCRLSREQVEIIFNYFLTEFYYDIGHAQGDNAKIEAIAKLIQRLEWLHPSSSSLTSRAAEASKNGHPS
jgi:Leucine-rich repeat (LRR) protein